MPFARVLGALLALCAAAAMELACAQEPSLDELIARARKRDAEAEYALALRAYEGRGIARDPVQALRLAERAAQHGNLEAQNTYGFFLQHGVGTEPDPARARQWYETAANRGHAGAQVNLGSLYEQGLGVERSRTTALEWYRKAMAQGSPEAEFNAANVLETDSPPDAAAAAAGYARAAAKGLAPGNFRLGRLIEQERVPASQYGSALERYAAAAAGGVADAQKLIEDPETIFRLCQRLEPAPALPWLRKAAAKGFAPAQLALGIALEEGRGTARDPAEAALWYAKAGEARNAEALYRLSQLYDEGSGVTRDTVRARDLLSQAADLGNRRAQERVDALLGTGLGPLPAGDPFRGLR